MHMEKLLRTLFVLLVIRWLLPHTVIAHGEDSLVLVEKQPIEPYQVSLLVSPATVRVGEMHFMVVINEQHYNRTLWTPALDQRVTIELQPLAGEAKNSTEPLLAAALLIAEPPVIAYEAALVLPDEGRYQITVEMVDAQQVRRRLITEVEARSLNLFQGLIVGLGIQTILITVWLIKEGLLVWSRCFR